MAEYLLYHPGVALIFEGFYGLVVKVHAGVFVDMLDPDRFVLFGEIVDRCVVPGALSRSDPFRAGYALAVVGAARLARPLDGGALEEALGNDVAAPVGFGGDGCFAIVRCLALGSELAPGLLAAAVFGAAPASSTAAAGGVGLEGALETEEFLAA